LTDRTPTLSRRDPRALVDAAVAGDRAAVARLISLVERGGDSALEVARLTHGHGGQAYTVGITGAPGAGKSSITDKVISIVRATGADVGVLAVDPSSPFSGGAFLGDRTRMQDHALDAGVFIRSMASRGHLGGLALATPQAVRVLDAAGLPWVLIETVGVGQVEVEVAAAADTTVVVVNPGWGDAVQANKAGLLEIADLFVINKADRPGARETERDLRDMLGNTTRWAKHPSIVHTVALDGTGIDEMWEAVVAHRHDIEVTGELAARRSRRAADEVREIVVRRIEQRAFRACAGAAFEELTSQVVARSIDPYTAAGRILAEEAGEAE
jgi:LAO/AO transport system kinase